MPTISKPISIFNKNNHKTNHIHVLGPFSERIIFQNNYILANQLLNYRNIFSIFIIFIEIDPYIIIWANITMVMN